MAKVDPRDFLLNTDFGMDKIIYYTDYNTSVSDITTITIPHGLPTAPLVFGVWATNPDFVDSRNLDEGKDPWNRVLESSAYADMQNVYLRLTPDYNAQGYVQTDFYVRIFGFEPGSNWDGLVLKGKKIAPTSKYAKEFIINTDYNYLKLVKAGEITTTYDPTDQSWRFPHNLGYVPQVLLWWSFGADEDDNIEFNIEQGFSYTEDNNKSGYFIDDKNVYMYMGILPHSTEIRLYGDEA
jgi:hypothetical protein